jgi:hypothetical protein
VVPKAFSMSKKTAAVDILLSKLRITWSVSRAVTCMETKLACFKQASFFNMLLDYIIDDFFV